MSNRLRILPVVLVCLVSIPALAGQATPQPDPPKQCPRGQYCKDVARVTTTGDRVRGPVTLILKNVNVLRYVVGIGETVTYPSGPDLSKLGFIPLVGGTQAAQPVEKAEKARVTECPPDRPNALQEPDWQKTNIKGIFEILAEDKSAIEGGWNTHARCVATALDKVNKGTTDVATLVRSSDTILQTDGGRKAILVTIDELLGPEGTVKPALDAEAQWPSDGIATLADNVKKLKSFLDKLPTKDPAYPTVTTSLAAAIHGNLGVPQVVTVASSSGLRVGSWVYIDAAPNREWVEVTEISVPNQIKVTVAKDHDAKAPVVLSDNWSDWYGMSENKQRFDTLKSDANDLEVKIAGIDISSDKAKAFKDAIAALKGWRSQLVGIQKGGESSFLWTVREGCGFAFSSNKEIQVALTKADRLATPPSTSTQPIVTVVCSSPVTISSGFGFARLKESNFAFVQSVGPKDPTTNLPTVVSKFGLTSQSNYRVVPVALINTRLWEPNETFALHFSAGAAVSLSSGAVGNEAEYVVGGSLSFKRTVLVTLGGEVGRESSLAGGFGLGDPVPSNLDSPPLQKQWKLGLAVLFTYIIR
jgi:hypothetical protein